MPRSLARGARFALALAVATAIVGCGPFTQATPKPSASPTPLAKPVSTDKELSDGSKPEGNGRPDTTYHATYNSNTIDIDADTAARAVKSVSRDYTTYTLDGSVPQLQDLAAGKVLLLEGQDLIKVTGVQKNGSDLIVTATQAALTDAITDGQIGWKYDVNFADQQTTKQLLSPSPSPTALGSEQRMQLAALHRATAEHPDAVLLGNTLVDFGPTMHQVADYTVHAVDAVPARHFRGTVADFAVDATINPESLGGLIFDLDARDTSSDRIASRVKVHGRVGRLLTSSDIRIVGSQLAGLQVDQNELSGDITLEWTAAMNNAQYTTERGLPIPLTWTTPFIVGPIVGTFTSKAKLTVNPQIRGTGTSAGKLQVVYNGAEHISDNGSGASVTGSLGRAQFAITGRTITAGFIPTGMGVDIEFPRFELSLYRSLTLFVSFLFHGFGYYSPGGFFGGRACQEAGGEFSGFGGVSLSLFGLHEHDIGQRELFPKQRLDRYLNNQRCR